MVHVACLFSPKEHFIGRRSDRNACLVALTCLDFLVLSYQPVVFFSFFFFLFHRLSANVAAIPPLFRKLPQGVAVAVDRGERHRPRGPAQTVEFSWGAQIQEGLESRVGAHLLAGGLVRQTPRRHTFCVVAARQRGSTRAVGRRAAGSSAPQPLPPPSPAHKCRFSNIYIPFF